MEFEIFKKNIEKHLSESYEDISKQIKESPPSSYSTILDYEEAHLNHYVHSVVNEISFKIRDELEKKAGYKEADELYEKIKEVTGHYKIEKLSMDNIKDCNRQNKIENEFYEFTNITTSNDLLPVYEIEEMVALIKKAQDIAVKRYKENINSKVKFFNSFLREEQAYIFNVDMAQQALGLLRERRVKESFNIWRKKHTVDIKKTINHKSNYCLFDMKLLDKVLKNMNKLTSMHNADDQHFPVEMGNRYNHGNLQPSSLSKTLNNREEAVKHYMFSIVDDFKRLYRAYLEELRTRR